MIYLYGNLYGNLFVLVRMENDANSIIGLSTGPNTEEF